MEHAKERFQAFLLEVGAKPSTLLSKERFDLIRRYLLQGTTMLSYTSLYSVPPWNSCVVSCVAMYLSMYKVIHKSY